MNIFRNRSTRSYVVYIGGIIIIDLRSFMDKKAAKLDLRYLEFDFEDKKIFFVKDHRVALLCWCDSLKKNLIKTNSTLIHVDKHADFAFNEENLDISEKLLELKQKEIEKFIRNLRCDNSEFITNAMFSTLIKDGITISSKNDCSFGKLVKSDCAHAVDKRTFESKSITHDFYIYDSDSLVEFDYIISDPYEHQDTKLLFTNSESLILDIDLDFFTYNCDGIFSRNPLDIKRQIISRSFSIIFDKSNIITIALEPACCGGIIQCINILHVFDRFFFSPRGLDILDSVISELLHVDKDDYDFIPQIC